MAGKAWAGFPWRGPRPTPREESPPVPMTGQLGHLHIYCHRLTPNPTSRQARPTTERTGRPVDIGQDDVESRRAAPVESDCGQGVRTHWQN